VSTLPLFDRSPVFALDPPKLRPYQTRGIQTLRNRVREGKRRVLLVLPTGGGKMVLIASIIRTSSVPVLFVCHRMELIDQCVDQLAKLGITNVGVMRADDERTDASAATQVASIQTLARRKKPHAGLVLVDEAHRAAADTYLDLFEHYRQSIILGFTATPTRFDGRPLGNLFECLEVVSTYVELIHEGFIVAPDCYSAPARPDLLNVRVVGGDYEDGALGEAMREKKLVGNLLDHWMKLAHLYPKPGGAPGLVEGPRRRTFIFAASIAHSRDICDRFAAAGVRIAHLDGTTPEVERRQIIKALGDGELEAVSNVGVLTEGVDVPSAKCVVHARPTQSLVLWRQTTGRILRPWHPGCPLGCVKHPSIEPLVLDHADNIARHGFPHEDLHWELHQKARRLDHKTRMKVCKGCYAYVVSSRHVCPYCGYEFRPEDEPKSVEETAEQLVRRETTPEAMQRAFFDDMVQLARRKGYRPGFASAKFKDHYGAWPPWGWSEAIRASFASDPDWQAAFEANQTRKEKYAEQKKKEESEIEVDLNDALEDPSPDSEPEEGFGEWLKDQGIR
jgi:DNA repair protein RadD